MDIPVERRTRNRIVVLGVVTLLLAPVVASGVSAWLTAESPETDDDALADVENVTFISGQGKEFSPKARAMAINTTTGEPVWVHDELLRYYDVDPIGRSTVLFTGTTGNYDDYVAVRMNWRTGEVYDRFDAPHDVHDVDWIDDSTYVVADKAENRVFVYNSSTNTTVWEYEFENHFPPYPEAGGKDTGYTHLNDVDCVDDCRRLLVSPRNFDRVMLINRSTKELEWVLGEEDNYSVLNEQHNPTLLSQDPPTVLVADSHNDRVIEYRKNGSRWEATWSWSDDRLDWPRDADRLPNGNTLVTDTQGGRYLEVTPNGTVVWSYEPSFFAPYDAERLRYGDEPQGPAMNSSSGPDDGSSSSASERDEDGGVVELYDEYYNLTQWVLPSWIGRIQLGLLTLAVVLSLCWGVAEIRLYVGRRYDV